MSIQGIVGAVTAGTSIANAFLVFAQRVNFDVKTDQDASGGLLAQLAGGLASIGGSNVGFLFTYRGEDVVELRSDITDHYSEGNTAIQDQIALAPEKITLRGYVGELSDVLPGILGDIQLIASQLTALSPYLPQLTTQAQSLYSKTAEVYQAAAAATAVVQQTFDLFSSDKTFQTKQQKAFGYFYERYKARSLFTVQTPWNVFSNMAIESLRAVQEADTNMVSDFEITFKKMRFASTIASATTIMQGRRGSQASSQVIQATQGGTNVGAFTPGAGAAGNAGALS